MAGFVGGLELALPFFTGDSGLMTGLEPVLGNIREAGGNRWQQLIESNCRTGQEFVRTWGRLRLEAMELTTFLGTTLEGPLGDTVLAAGGEMLTGAQYT